MECDNKKRVHFAADDKLVSIHIFQTEKGERENVARMLPNKFRRMDEDLSAKRNLIRIEEIRRDLRNQMAEEWPPSTSRFDAVQPPPCFARSAPFPTPPGSPLPDFQPKRESFFSYSWTGGIRWPHRPVIGSKKLFSMNTPKRGGDQYNHANTIRSHC